MISLEKNSVTFFKDDRIVKARHYGCWLVFCIPKASCSFVLGFHLPGFVEFYDMAFWAVDSPPHSDRLDRSKSCKRTDAATDVHNVDCHTWSLRVLRDVACTNELKFSNDASGSSWDDSWLAGSLACLA